MTPDEFISKWSAVTLTERSAAQSHFIDLCAMLSVPTPTDADPKGTFYTFEKLTDKDTGHRGFADVWYQGQFAWEYKKKRANLDDALIQLRQYSGALGNPPLLVVCDMGRIRVVPQFTGYVTTPIDIAITDLADARVRETLRHLWNDPNALKPTQTREGVTLEAARQFGIIADRLRSRDATEPHTVAHFLIRVLFCLFAENIRLLPHKHFSTMLERFRTTPEGFMRRVATIFGVMATGGEDGNEIIPYFNGDLFTKSTDEVLKLQKDDLTVLSVAASHDWSSVAPSIFGTLFERGLDPSKRSQIGAHYTSEADIIDVVEPVVMAPLRRHWNEIRTQLEAQVAQNKLRPTEASKLLRETIYAISQTTVLDPACGSGNFLYVTLKLLHELEFEIITWHIRHNLLAPYPSVGPQQLYGIEINTYAAELARAVIWIGHLQWMLEHGYGAGEPVLQRLDNIVNTDALINVATGTITEWPKVTCIVSNPPFLGSKRLRIELGDEYMDEIWKKYDTLVSRESDLVCYFVEHARHQLVAGKRADYDQFDSWRAEP